MRQYTKDDREIIQILMQNDNQKRLGSLLIGRIFGLEQIALLSRKGECSVLFESSKENGQQIQSHKAQLTDMLSLLDYLEQQGYLYCLDYTGNEDLLFCTSSDPQIAVNKENTRHSHQGGYIEYTNGEYSMYNSSCTMVMKGHVISSLLAQKLRHFLMGEIYATAQLSNLVANNFKAEETLQYEEQMKYAIRGLHISWGAFIVSILAMILNVPLSNRCGYSTINSEQFAIIDSIHTDVSKIRSVTSRMPLINASKDSIQKVKNSQEKKN